jgi:predicted RNA-binding protein with PUA-like domain
VKQFEVNAGIRIQGSTSVIMPKKSFRLFFRKQYGLGTLKYAMFGQGNISSFDELVLKSGYDDDVTATYSGTSKLSGTLLRDALSVELWNKMGSLPQYSSWAVLYLNNRFWGIYDIRESIDENYIINHTGLHEFDLIRFHNDSTELKYGSRKDWDSLYSFVTGNTFENDKNFNDFTAMVDMTEFIKLMSFAYISQYYSWGWGISMYRQINPNLKWKFLFWDTDRSYTNVNWNGFTDFQNTSTYRWANIFPKKLLVNSEFKRLQVNGICDLLNTTFVPTVSVNTFDSLYNIINPEIASELARWNPSNTVYDSNIQLIRENLTNRPSIILSQIKSYFKLNYLHNVTVNVNGKGTVKLNTLNLTQFPWSGNYFENNAIDLEAIPDKGYKFVGWDNIGISSNTKLKKLITSNTTVTANFEYDPNASIANVSDNEKIIISPNPITSYCDITFSLLMSTTARVSVYSLNGKEQAVLFEGIMNEPIKTIRWNTQTISIPKGIYLLKVESREGAFYKKIVKL